MTTGPESQCANCLRRTDGDWPAPATCEAFPTGIPAKVYANGLDHRQPIDGDHGLRWESSGQPFDETAFLPQFLGVGGKP